MKKFIRAVLLVVGAGLIAQIVNFFLIQKDGYFECRKTTAAEVYYFEFERSFFSVRGTCPRTGAFDQFAVATGKATIAECLKAFSTVQEKGSVCEKVPVRP